MQRMDGIGHVLDIARHGFAIAVRQERCDPPLMHPRYGIDVESGLALALRRIVVAPGAEREAAFVMSCPEHEDIAFAELHALCRLDFLEFLARDRLAGLEPVDLAMAGRIEQDAASGYAGRISGDATPLGTARGQQRRRLAVIELPAVTNVIECIDMRVAIAVARHCEIAHAEGKPALAHR